MSDSDIDLDSVFGAIKTAMDREVPELSKAQVDDILAGKQIEGFEFAGKALSKKIKGVQVGLIMVRDTASGEEHWYGIDEAAKEVYGAHRLPALEFKISTIIAERGK